jgi:hypothetical protein
VVAFNEIEDLANKMDVLGESVLNVLGQGEWTPMVYAQLKQRDRYYEQISHLWDEGDSLWVHVLPDTDMTYDVETVNASHCAFSALELVLHQNQRLQDELTTSMLQVDTQLKQTVQRKKFEQAYHPPTDFSGGFVTEQG